MQKSKSKNQKHKLKNLKMFRYFWSLFFIFYFLFFIFITPTHAATFSLGIFPPIIEIISRPGLTVNSKLRIINNGDPASLKVYFQSFKPADELGHPEYLAKNEEEDEAVGWASLESASEIFPGEFNVGVEETRDFNLILKIPKTTKEDDHYLTVFFELLPFGETNNTHAKTSARIGANILLTVSDRKIIPKYGEITEFKAPFFVESGPVNFSLKVKNNGRTFFKPLGSVKIYNTIMKETGKIEILPQNVLAGSVRALTDKSILAIIKEQEKKVLGIETKKYQVSSIMYQAVQKIFPFFFSHNTKYLIPNTFTSTPYLSFPSTFLLGRYTAVASFTLDENGPTLTAKTTFFAFPIRIALAILAAVGLLLIIKKRLKT